MIDFHRFVTSFKKHNLCTSRAVLPLPLLFSRLSTILFIDREIHETIPLQCRRCFSLFYEKNFSCWMSAKHWCCKLQALKGGNFGPKLTHLPLWILIGHFFFTCEKHCSLLWLGKTYFRMKINDMTNTRFSK